MKEGAAALTVECQDPGALRVMMDRAREKKVRAWRTQWGSCMSDLVPNELRGEMCDNTI